METLRTSLLKQILRNLDWYDLQSAMQVCRRWEKVAFWMQVPKLRLSIVPDIGPNVTEYQYDKLLRYHSTLMESRRRYRHITFFWGSWDGLHEPDRIKDILFLEIIRRFRRSLVSLTIVSDGYCMIPWVMSAIIRSCPWLKALNLNGMVFNSLSFFHDWGFPTRIHTLEDANHVINCSPMAPDYFNNVTTLHVTLTIQNHLYDLFRKLSPQLISLTLEWDTEQYPTCVKWPREYFPRLQTLVLKTMRAETGEQLGHFLRRMPALNSLTLSPHLTGDISVISWISSINLWHLDVWPVFVSVPQVLLITRFQSLKSICIRGDYNMHNRLPDTARLPNTGCLALQGYTWQYVLDKLLMVFPNLVELELQTAENWKWKDARAINSLKSLNHLILHEGVQTLEKFMQFCEDLMVPSICVVSKHYALNCDYLSREYIACNIRKFSVHALEINPCTCDHLIQSMPNLNTLELTLQKPLDQSIYQGICTRNPQCGINRHWYKPYRSILNLYEQSEGIHEMMSADLETPFPLSNLF